MYKHLFFVTLFQLKNKVDLGTKAQKRKTIFIQLQFYQSHSVTVFRFC